MNYHSSTYLFSTGSQKKTQFTLANIASPWVRGIDQMITISERKASFHHRHASTDLSSHSYCTSSASRSTTSVMAESLEKHLQETMVSPISGKDCFINQSDQQVGEEKYPEMIKSSASGTSEDPMLGFLTLLAKVERPACANCESKDLSPMFFCNTCSQAICAVCKQNTHSAKMFSRHDVTSVSPYTKEPQRKCPVHYEMCIMFSPANESLLCINCFRDLPPDIRAQCLDLDTAYQQKCDRLHRGLKAVGELEVIIKDEMSAYRSLLKELHINAMREESTIHVFSKILQGIVTQTEDKLIETVKSELQTKEMIFEEKLNTLESLQSNVQAYLTLSTAFISSASKFELLKLANGLVERLSDIGNIVQPAKISPENSVISSNFKAEFSQSLKELLHQELWMHNHLASFNDFSSPLKNTGEETSKSEQSCCSTNSNLVMPQPETKVPLPFLGRSQSLLNIPLDLNKQLIPAIEPEIVVVKQQAVLPVQPPTSSVPQPVRRSAGSNSTTKRCASKSDARYQSLPHNSKEEPKPQHRREASSTMPHPVRSKSVESKSVIAQQQYDVSQLELFAAIHQSRQAVSSRTNSKNLTVTSALVGVRQSDRNASSRTEQKKSGSTVADPLEKVVPATAKNPSGHVCVVQALVHQDGDAARNSSATQAETNKRLQQRQRAWEPVYEPLDGHAGRPVKSDADILAASETSIELTADQVRQLIRAISAAQSNTAGSLGGCWSSEISRPSASSSRTTERDAAKQPSAHQHRNIHRNDSFEGHEEAVRMLVGAIQEIQQLCTDNKHDPN